MCFVIVTLKQENTTVTIEQRKKGYLKKKVQTVTLRALTLKQESTTATLKQESTLVTLQQESATVTLQQESTTVTLRAPLL
jgi:hypothetical protein